MCGTRMRSRPQFPGPLLQTDVNTPLSLCRPSAHRIKPKPLAEHRRPPESSQASWPRLSLCAAPPPVHAQAGSPDWAGGQQAHDQGCLIPPCAVKFPASKALSPLFLQSRQPFSIPHIKILLSPPKSTPRLSYPLLEQNPYFL